MPVTSPSSAARTRGSLRTRAAVLAALVSLGISARGAPAAAQSLPDRLTDSTFWSLVTNISEPGGYFRSDNFVSNETTLQWVIPELLRTVKPNGVYLGVGPDQNFTYVVALKPRMAFIFDIRRQNVVTHLMYKALIEASADRADFVSRLFARPRPTGLDSTSTPEAIFRAFAPVMPDSAAYRRNLADLKDRLTRQHGFKISDDDMATLTSVYDAFVDAGPEITYNYSTTRGGGYRRGYMPTYAEIQMGTDSAHVHRSYLGTEANYRTLKDLETRNVIVPVVGDFAGPNAIRAVGAYLKEHQATVSVFYLSNVEQYLFQQDDDWSRFYNNVATLPLDSTSTFIRSVFGGMGYYRSGMGMRAQQMLASMTDQLKRFSAGTLSSYADVIRTSR